MTFALKGIDHVKIFPTREEALLCTPEDRQGNQYLAVFTSQGKGWLLSEHDAQSNLLGYYVEESA